MDKDSKPSGRGYHKRRKKGVRSHFKRRKNDERLRRSANKVSQPSTKFSQSLADPSEGDSTLSLPPQWQRLTSTESSHYFKVGVDCNEVCQVTRSVVVKPDNTWSVYISAKGVPKACSVLCRFSSPLLSTCELSSLIKDIDKAILCPGNPDEKFVTICQMRGGSIKGARGRGDTIAFVDSSPVTDSTGKSYSCTVRRVDCEIICERAGQYPLRCKSCQAFRSTLRSSVSRQKKASNNHTSTE